MNSDPICILGIDPGTHIAGFCCILATPGHIIGVNSAVAIHGDYSHTNPDSARSGRVQRILEGMEAWMAPLPGISVVGIEWPYYDREGKRSSDAPEALYLSIGAILSHRFLYYLPQYRIDIRTAKGLYGASKFTRDKAKLACIAWANREYHLGLGNGPDDEAKADALSVAVATWEAWRKQFNLPAHKPLFGEGSGTKRSAGTQPGKRNKELAAR